MKKPKDPKKLKVGEIVQYTHYDHKGGVGDFSYCKVVSIDREEPAYAIVVLEDIQFPFKRIRYIYNSYTLVGIQRANALVKLGYMQKLQKPLCRLFYKTTRLFCRAIAFYREEVHDLLIMFLVGMVSIAVCLFIVGLLLLGLVHPFIN